MDVVLSGASGLIGQALAIELRDAGHQVRTLVRRPARGPEESEWDPAAGRVDEAFVTSADAVVCLSGVGVGDHRWTERHKRAIVASRVSSVGTLARALAASASPTTFVAASAVGYYGDTGERTVTEQTPSGSTFLAEVCRQWEAAADPARDAGVRVAHLRTGLVLAADGGLLARLVPIAKLGVAGKLGSGRQFMPWISLADEVGAIRFLVEAGPDGVSGPVNLTGPAPVRNAEFMSELGRVLNRPTVLPTPAFALRIVLGEFAEDTLTGQCAMPAVLTAAGYEFQHADVAAALHWALSRP